MFVQSVGYLTTECHESDVAEALRCKTELPFRETLTQDAESSTRPAIHRRGVLFCDAQKTSQNVWATPACGTHLTKTSLKLTGVSFGRRMREMAANCVSALRQNMGWALPFDARGTPCLCWIRCRFLQCIWLVHIRTAIHSPTLRAEGGSIG